MQSAFCALCKYAGFRERSAAFDLKAVLEDFVRFLERQKQAQKTVTIDVSECRFVPVRLRRLPRTVIA